MSKTVVVLGASFAGLAVSHRLLKYTRQTEKNVRVVLVSPVWFLTRFFFFLFSSFLSIAAWAVPDRFHGAEAFGAPAMWVGETQNSAY